MAESVQEEIAASPGVKTSLYTASTRQLMWHNFKKHKLAMISLWVICFIYFVGVFADFFAPYNLTDYNASLVNAPPQRLRFVSDAGFQLRPFVYGYSMERNPVTFRMEYTVDPEQKFDLYLFNRGSEYRFWGLWETDLHFFGVREGYVLLLGADPLGRDMVTRLLYGSRISTSIGLVGVAVSFLLGITLGGVAGLYGGTLDNIVQRIIEILRSIPTIPLWMGLSAALPADIPPLRQYLAITIILSLIGWTGLARVVRSKFLSMREEDFVMAARLTGVREMSVVFRHMLPNFFSHIIASLTLSIPAMILGETALSFLGLGLRAPIVSWGVLLQRAQNVRTVALAPWLLLPGLAVVITVLAFNFIGDGLRDAADPQGHGR